MLRLVGKEILVPAYHHGVEVEALVDAGAKVKFYRVGGRWDVDLKDVERRIGPETGALYLIHYAGFPGPTDAMRALVRCRNTTAPAQTTLPPSRMPTPAREKFRRIAPMMTPSASTQKIQRRRPKRQSS